MSSTESIDYESISSTTPRELDNICPYCSQVLSLSELRSHLDHCSLYREVSNRNSSARSRLFSALRDSLTLYRPWPQDEQSDDWSSSSVYSSESSDRSTPEFNPTANPLKVSNVICPICFDNFNSEILRPLILPKCGHTVCVKCLKHIMKASSIIKCPVCRKTNPTEISKLPVNYALFDICDTKEDAQKCDKHMLEIVGYCQDDSQLLCGACVIDHNNHECFSLTDPRINEITDKHKLSLLEEEKKILALREIWNQAQEEIEKLSKSINTLTKSHISQFKTTEKKIIDNIKSGKKMCVNQLQDIGLKDEIRDIENTITTKLNLLKQEINNIKVKKERFEEMDILDQLTRSALLKNDDNYKVPSLGPLYKIVLKLQAEVNYKSAIKKHHISL
jgi:RING-type zinc-finger/B-box zinc finger